MKNNLLRKFFMNTSDILLARRWNFYQKTAPSVSKEIYNLLQCYDEMTPYLEIFHPESYGLSDGEDSTIFLGIMAQNNSSGYKVYLYIDRQFQEIQDLGLLCEIYTRLSFQMLYREPNALAKNRCKIDLSKMPED